MLFSALFVHLRAAGGHGAAKPHTTCLLLPLIVAPSCRLFLSRLRTRASRSGGYAAAACGKAKEPPPPREKVRTMCNIADCVT